MKTIIKIFICFSIIYTPFFAFAGSAEQWTIVENFYDSPSNSIKVTAKKITQDAANSGVYKVQIPVSSSILGNTVKTMMWTGIAVAGVEAMLEGIGWVIDKGSKTIKREKPQVGIGGMDIDPNDPGLQYHWQSYAGGKMWYGSTSDALCEIAGRGIYKNNYQTYKASQDKTYCFPDNQPSFPLFRIQQVANPNYDPSAPPVDPNANPQPEYEIMTDSQLGNEIIGKGENTQPLPDAVEQAYSPNNPASDAPAPKQSNDALNNANPQPEKEPDGKSETEKEKDPATGQETGKEISKFELPNFCSWAPAVCDFFKVQKQDNKEIKENQKTDIAQNQSFFEKVSDWFDWSKEDTDLPDDEKPQISEIPTPELKEDAIRWSAQCPADAQVPINMQGVSSTITFSWSPWCQLLAMIKPAIVVSAYIGAAFIVLGLRT